MIAAGRDGAIQNHRAAGPGSIKAEDGAVVELHMLQGTGLPLALTSRTSTAIPGRRTSRDFERFHGMPPTSAQSARLPPISARRPEVAYG